MLTVLLQMMFIIAAGMLWQWLSPGSIDSRTVRISLTNAVYYVFLPALVFQVLSHTAINLDSVRISFVASISVLAAMLFTWLVCRSCGMPRAITGAVILAAAFPNATYLGLPVLEALFGPQTGRGIAIQYDVFACTPLLLTVGMFLAARFGTEKLTQNPLMMLLRVPAVLAAIAGIVVQQLGIILPDMLEGALKMLSAAVVPIMLLAIGLSLRMNFLFNARWGSIMVVSLTQLVLMPLLALSLANVVGLQGTVKAGAVLEAAMPSMLLGIVICDRFGLDSAVYAAAVTVTTLLSLLTLPFWYSVLM